MGDHFDRTVMSNVRGRNSMRKLWEPLGGNRNVRCYGGDGKGGNCGRYCWGNGNVKCHRATVWGKIERDIVEENGNMNVAGGNKKMLQGELAM